MADVIRMPLLSDTMTEGKIVKWNKKTGDKVKSDDVLAEVETDKATMEVMGYADGTLLYIGVPEGSAAKVNDIIAIVGKDGEDISALLNTTSTKETTKKTEESKTVEASSTPTITPEQLGVTVIRMPLLSDTMTEGKIVVWNKKVGDTVKSDDNLADVETDKATMEVMGYADGTLLYIGVPEGKAAKVNDIIAIVGKAGTDVSALLNSLSNTPSLVKTSNAENVTNKSDIEVKQETTTTADDRLKASPLAKKIAKDKGIDLKSVHGSGDGGRIVKRDLDNFVPTVISATTTSTKTESPVVPAFIPVSGEEGYVDIPNSQMRKTIARRLSESMYNAPHFYLTMELNMDGTIAARNKINESSIVKISFQDILIKAAAMALKKHPAVNSSWMGDVIRQYKHIHVGSAVAVEEGLIVPVIKHADQKSLSQIASEAKELYSKAKNKKLQPQEFSGNTFTISNLGMMDIDEFTAIINPPDSCILAVGKIKEIVVKTNDGFGVRNVMKITLSCDHRSVDGAVGAAFLQTLKQYVENPVSMLV